MLEVFLAIVVIIIISVGVITLFTHGSDQSNLSASEQELNSIAYTYSQLAANGLTSDVSDQSSLVKILYNSRRLSTSYFEDANPPTVILSPFGDLVFDSAGPYSFTVVVPLGGDRTEDQITAFYNTVQDNYVCEEGCDSSSSGASDAGDSITLSFNMAG